MLRAIVEQRFPCEIAQQPLEAAAAGRNGAIDLRGFVSPRKRLMKSVSTRRAAQSCSCRSFWRTRVSPRRHWRAFEIYSGRRWKKKKRASVNLLLIRMPLIGGPYNGIIGGYEQWRDYFVFRSIPLSLPPLPPPHFVDIKV